MEYSLLLQCFTKQWNKPRRGGNEEKGCEAERVEDEEGGGVGGEAEKGGAG